MNLTEIDAASDLNASTVSSQFKHICDTCAHYYSNSEYTDFTLICPDGSIPVHRVFLAKKSPVFKKMFEEGHKTAELETNLETMKEVVRFIYCNTSDFENVKSITNVLRAAEKYEINELIDQCIEGLMEQINKENAVEILDIAVLHCQEELEKKCLAVILK
jgi:protein tyrosine phosphatase